MERLAVRLKLFHFDFSLIFGVGAIGTIIEKLGLLRQSGYRRKPWRGFRVWLADDIA